MEVFIGFVVGLIIGFVVGLIIGGVCISVVKSSEIQSIKSQKQANDEQIKLLHSQRESLSQENNEKKQRLRYLEEIIQAKEK